MKNISRICVLVVLGFFVSMNFIPAVHVGAVPPPSPSLFEIPGPMTYQASAHPFGPANEVHVAVNPLDDDHLLVVAKDYSLGDCDFSTPSGSGFHVGSASYVTKDGGLTWTRSRVPMPYPFVGPIVGLPYACGSDPVALFGPDGTAYYVVLNFDYQGPNLGRRAAIAVARSPDGGETWPGSEIRIVEDSPVVDKEWGAVDDEGRLHIVWSDHTTNTIWYRRSNTAFEFTEPAINMGSGLPGAQVDCGTDDEVYVFWRSGNNIRFRRSTNEGADFEPMTTPFIIDRYHAPYDTPRIWCLPSIVVDDKPDSDYTGRIYLAWQDEDGLAYSNIWMRYSDNEGDTWSAAVLVDENDDPALRSIFPSMSLSRNGRVDIAWMQEGPDANVFNAYAARSFDGGFTWSQYGAVSDRPVIAEFSFHQSGSYFIGDYIGSASTNCRIWVAHPQTHGINPPSKIIRTDAYLTKVSTCWKIDIAVNKLGILISEIEDHIRGPIGPWPPCPPVDCPLNPGQGNSLITKLEVATNKLSQLNVKAASGVLKAFYNEVKALMKASVIPPDLGRSWDDSATEIRNLLV
ncbi:MAG: hypothetical protein JSW00_03915 [Thermoplasmata archaeon]|nr:MAG: hypothetical protein JSW00_03915 [Thermoplasmata archaeon]